MIYSQTLAHTRAHSPVQIPPTDMADGGDESTREKGIIFGKWTMASRHGVL